SPFESSSTSCRVVGGRPGSSRLVDGGLCIALQDLPPAAAEVALHALGGVAEAVEVPMLEVDARPLRAEDGEADLDLGHEGGVVLELGVELPGEDEAARRVPRDHLAPVAGRAVLPDLVPAAVGLGLDHARLERRGADVVL